MTVTGNISDPDLKFGQDGKARLNLRINATHRRQNRQTQQWEDHGAQLWYGATLWERDAERWAELLHKGDQVSIRGVHVKREYQTRDGGQGVADDIANARMLGFRPKDTQGHQPQGGNQGTHAAPAGGQQDDPWRSQPQQQAGQPFHDAGPAPF